MSLAALLFGLAGFSTIFCTAVNAYTLIVGYPLWRFVGEADFGSLHREYLRRLNPVITIPHVLMFFATAALVFTRPAALSLTAACAICALAWFTVGISAFAAGPVHDRFSESGICDEAGMRSLMRISRARTAMMLVASCLLLRAVVAGLS